jgi:hypothetical protein
LIIHSLNTNFAYHLYCPICSGAWANKKQLEDLSRYKKRLTDGKKIIFKNNEVDRNTMRLKKVTKCSKCNFEIMYTLNLNKEIKRVN